MNTVLQVVRTRCKTCTHSYDPRELLAGSCSYCLADRVKALDEFADLFTSAQYRCQNCNAFILAGAYRHWDVLAKRFSLLCVKCADEAISGDSQYRGTPFGWAHKAY